MERSKQFNVLLDRIEDIFLLHNGEVLAREISMYYGANADLNVAETLKTGNFVFDTIFGRTTITPEGEFEGSIDFNQNTIKHATERAQRTSQMLSMMA